MKQTRAFFNRFSIGVTALWLLLFALLPNIGLLVVTVLTRGEQDFVLPQFTLDNYLRLLDPTFLKILWESLWLAFMSTLACLAWWAIRSPTGSPGQRQDEAVAAPAGHHPVLDELAYPYLCAHPDPQGQQGSSARCWCGSGLRNSPCPSCTAISRCSWASCTRSCRSWFCRCTHPSKSWTAACSTRPGISGPAASSRSGTSRSR